MKNINFMTGLGLVCLVSALFCGTASAGYCINQETGKLVRCQVQTKKNTSKSNVPAQIPGKPVTIEVLELPENGNGKGKTK